VGGHPACTCRRTFRKFIKENVMDDRRSLGFVAPHRRPEVLRRIKTVERFLAAPGRRAATEAAATLGLGVTQFYALAKIWREGGKPEDLAGSGRRKARTTSLSAEQVALFVDADREMPLSLAARVVERATELGAERCVTPPSDVVMHKHLTRLRAGRVAIVMAESRADFVVDHCALDLAVLINDVAHGEIATMPIVTIVFEMAAATATPVGVALSLGLPGPAQVALALAHALRPASPDGGDHRDAAARKPCIIRINADRRPGWTALWFELTAAGIRRIGKRHPVVPGGVITRSILGDRLFGFRLRPQTTHKPPLRRQPTLRAGQTPVTMIDAENLLREHVEAISLGTTLGLDLVSAQTLRLSLLSLGGERAIQDDANAGVGR